MVQCLPSCHFRWMNIQLYQVYQLRVEIGGYRVLTYNQVITTGHVQMACCNILPQGWWWAGTADLSIVGRRRGCEAARRLGFCIWLILVWMRSDDPIVQRKEICIWKQPSWARCGSMTPRPEWLLECSGLQNSGSSRCWAEAARAWLVIIPIRGYQLLSSCIPVHTSSNYI